MAKEEKTKKVKKQEEPLENEESCECETCDCIDNEELTKLQEELNTSNEKYTRLQAEFINYQTRTQNEIAGMFKYEGETLIKNMLEVIDDFEMDLFESKYKES